jgi:2-polyprenyl-3-methyl-5-hydroxy-6-metoxy-1,4-benzoquinol methylase
MFAQACATSTLGLHCTVAEEGRSGALRRHWDEAYATRGVDCVSWYQAVPSLSLDLIDELGVTRGAGVIDVGGGASFLADELIARGHSDVTVLDISASALEST